MENLYKQVKGYDLKISLKEFERIVITDYFDILENNKDHSLITEINSLPLKNMSALLPIYNIETTAKKIEIGEYCIIKFQDIGHYFKDKAYLLSDTQMEMFTEEGFQNVPFVEIIVEARDERFAIEVP